MCWLVGGRLALAKEEWLEHCGSDWTLKIELDPDNELDEMNEYNNMASIDGLTLVGAACESEYFSVRFSEGDKYMCIYYVYICGQWTIESDRP